MAITREADLSIVKTDGTTTVAAGTSTTYTITLTNNGPSSVGAGVVVKDNIPANTTPSETEPNCSISGGVMTCTTTTSLLPGQSVTYSLTLSVPITYRDGGNTTLSNTAYIHSSPETDPDPTDNSSTDTDTVGAATVGSGSTMTDSAFQLKDDLGPWTITDFEILLNNRNVVVATNPGQFYYHQRATNPFSVATKWEFNLNWPKEFTAQMEGGNPIHAYVQLAGDPANTWRDWTPQSTGSCWTYSSPADNVNPNNLPNCGGQYGKITVNNVPAGAKVWVTVHLDFALKGTTQPQSITLPKTYGPFRSDITIKHQQTGLILGTSTSQTNLLGRGKKVTVVYGTTVNGAGNPVGGVWMKVQQGTGPSVFIRSDVTSGEYVIYDGQACGDGLTECSSAWTFANGTNVNTTITIYGNAVGGRSATPCTRLGTRGSARPAPPATRQRSIHRVPRSESRRGVRTTGTGSSRRNDAGGRILGRNRLRLAARAPGLTRVGPRGYHFEGTGRSGVHRMARRLLVVVLSAFLVGPTAFVPTAAADPAYLFVKVDFDGTLIHGSGALSVTHIAPGRYEVTFTSDVSGCAYVATTIDISSQALLVFTAGGHFSNTGVHVETKTQAGGLADAPFDLVVVCGGSGTAFAVIGAQKALLVRSTPGVTLTNRHGGRYLVSFPTSVAACAFLATVGHPRNGAVSAPAGVYTGSGPDGRTVYVETKNVGGGLTDGSPVPPRRRVPETVVGSNGRRGRLGGPRPWIRPHDGFAIGHGVLCGHYGSGCVGLRLARHPGLRERGRSVRSRDRGSRA